MSKTPEQRANDLRQAMGKALKEGDEAKYNVLFNELEQLCINELYNVRD